MKMNHRGILVASVSMSLGIFMLGGAVTAAPVELRLNPAHSLGAIDLSPYSLGQGGLSREPMFDVHSGQVKALKPRTIRLFVQEYFDLYPGTGRYHWDTLDHSLENILATGARPVLALCFKPKVLYPQLDQDMVHPNDYGKWEDLVEALVRHCNRERGYGIQYWEVGNEGDIGEDGGCPYRFKPNDYLRYYQHTVRAIRRADPTARVGGPALANYTNAIGDSLIASCGRGEAPLDFFSWHMYGNDPERMRRSIREIKAKLARYPLLAATETFIGEWNIRLLGRELTPGFQAAFVLETTLGFFEEGLSFAAYYHIRDHYVKPEDFRWMTPGGYRFMSDWWNVQVQNSGLFDKSGQRRPAWYVFQLMSQLRGERLQVQGATGGIRALAVRENGITRIACWNFPTGGAGDRQEVVLRVPGESKGQFRLMKLNAAANRADELRAGEISELAKNPLRLTLSPYELAWVEINGK